MTKRRHLHSMEEAIEKQEQQQLDLKKAGIIDALGRMQEIPECAESDVKALAFVQQVLYAMEYKKRQAWPDKELRSIVNKLDNYQKALFKEILVDIKNGLLEAGYENERH